MRTTAAMLLLTAALGACTGDTPPASTTTVAPSSPTTTVPTTTSTTAGAVSSTMPSTTTTPPPPLLALGWEEVADVGGFVTAIEPVGDGVLIATKDGRIRFVGTGGQSEAAFDLSSLVRDAGEQGLLDLALHPDGGRLFVHYTAGDGDTVLAELRYPGGRAEPVELFRVRQPAANHNGGSIEFGPDGMLYLALGDGGGANDRFGNGQRTDTPLAAIHRFDVSAEGVAVAAPGNPGFEVDTIWAYGVRNPWRIAFASGADLGLGEPILVVADVGQNAWEEVTVLPAAAAGQNLGWPIQEGRHCFERTPCDDADIRMAQVEIAHGDEGTCSITGGEVYAGGAIPELVGHYVFTDYCGGYLRSVDVRSLGDGPAPVVAWPAEELDGPAVVAAGPDGELLAGGADGRVRRLVPIR